MNKTLSITRCGNTEFRWGERTYVMGICNLSADSFSGDGLGANIEAAVAQAKRFVEEGADIIDVGGESTRPGTQPSAEDISREIDLVVPVIKRLACELTVPISIDTYKSEVARRAVDAGADMLNDIWGLKWDPRMATLAAETGLPIILMSNQRDAPLEGSIMPAVIAFLQNSIETALKAGIAPENIIIDPGVGFGKTVDQNLEIIRCLADLKAFGKPVLLATSRKSTIGAVLDLPVGDRVEGTAATVAIGIANGADMIRVHDVKPMVRVCRMSDAIIRGRHKNG